MAGLPVQGLDATGPPVWRTWLLAVLYVLVGLLSTTPTLAAPKASSASYAFTAAAPGGFDVLMAPQTTVADVYFGGKMVGTAGAEYRPGLIRFTDPDAVARLIPRLTRAAAVRLALSAEMPTHAERACSDQVSGLCHRLEPDLVGVVFDETRFRVDLFVNPAYLAVDTPLTSRYIPTPEATSVSASLGGVLSGSTGGQATYDLQGRLVANFKTAYLETEVTQSSTLGFQVQTLAAAVDRGPFRVQAGLLQTPGVDLIGQGRFYGAALSTQTDTLLNRDQISATPLLIYLANRAEVDVLRNGRLLASRQYEAGNQLIDTHSLPDGAYTVTLRIREIGGFTRDETRAFNKSRTLPPLGLPQFFLGAGILAQDNASGLPRASGQLLEASYSRRLSASSAFDLTATLVGQRTYGEVGFTFIGLDGLRLRVASIGASDGGFGDLIEATCNIGPWSVLNVDARQGWDDRGAHPIAASVTQALDQAYLQNQFGLGLTGSQLSANYAVAWRGMQVGLLAAYSSAPFSRSTHTFGPTLDAPIHIAGIAMRFIANAASTEHGLQAYFGIRLQLNHGKLAVYGDTGVASTTDGAGRRTFGPTAEVTASTDHNDERWGDATGSANFNHAQDRDTASLSGQLRGKLGDVTAQIDQDLSGGDHDTHYSAGFLIGAAVTPSHVAVGSASGGDSGVIVNIKGAPKGSEFEVLVNDSPRALIEAGEQLPIRLPSYRVYSVRLAPRGATALDFDTSSRDVSLYPGTIQALTWKAEKVVEIFGRAIDENNQPIAEAVIQGARAPGLTDENGYFQVEVSKDGKLRFERSRHQTCQMTIQGVAAASSHISMGTRKCYVLIIADGGGTKGVEVSSQAKGR